MAIRKAVFSDAPMLFQCTMEAFKDYILLIGRTPGPMLEDYSEAILSHHVFVAATKDGIDGLVLVKDGKGDFMWLDVLAVYPGKSNGGVGKALVQVAEEYIQSCGKLECRLYTHVKYRKPISMYQKLGYEIYDQVQEDGFDRYYMKKSLN